MRDWRDICRVGTFELEGREIPAVSLGTSPFIGAGQFGSKSGEYYNRFYQHPENIEAIIKCSAELGVPAVQALSYDRIIRAIIHAQTELGVKLFTAVTIGMVDWKRELLESEPIDPSICFIHARITDLRNRTLLAEIVDAIKQLKMIPGCATHAPERTIPFIEGSGLDIGCYLAPVNRTGFLLGEDPEKVLKSYENASRPVIAKKVLSAGRVDPEDAFSFVSEVHNVKGIAVGIASKQEAQKTFETAFRFWPKAR
jgi:hypothetical protein